MRGNTPTSAKFAREGAMLQTIAAILPDITHEEDRDAYQ
jgi:hypothetical protein